MTEKKYYIDKFQLLSGDIKKTWALLNKVINKNHTVSPTTSFVINGTITTDPVLIAEKLNAFFTTIGAELAKNISTTATSFETFLPNNYPNSLVLDQTTPTEIIAIVT